MSMLHAYIEHVEAGEKKDRRAGLGSKMCGRALTINRDLFYANFETDQSEKLWH
ncbi:hypothetical protein KSF_078060 [Reticulibacter mediterranei]|uniref:Uncharacterized protein n=1 Tax=Reticulibacter mediterranei TaxID=2778369 RepID=A0A8J3IPE9_9CHLR|nr:hypothetical protein KSF_078060 [Reticulibacter mediterranei]